MNKQHQFFMILILLSSCASPKPITSNVNPAIVNKVGVIPNISIISVLNARRNDEIKEGFLDNAAGTYADEAINTFLKNKKIDNQKLVLTSKEDSLITTEILGYFTKMNEKDVNYLTKEDKNYNTSNTREAFAEIKVSDGVSDLIKSKNLRFVLSTLTVGMKRTDKSLFNRSVGNVGKYIAASGLAYLTGGGIYFRSIPYLSNTYLILIDAESKNLAMFIKKTEEFDPTDKERLQEQVTFGLENYWVYHAAYHKKKYGNK
jgi:hypothetical protein